MLVALPLAAQQRDTLQTSPQDTISKAPIHLSSALVVGAHQNKVQNALMGVNYLRPEQVRSIPTLFGEVDIIKALQMQPGVSPGVDGFAGMMVRGGNDDQNLFLIDGNPIYQMNHFGGLFSAYNMEAVRDVAFYKSSFPARYGGRLSSVVDINTKPGDPQQYRGAFSIGLTSANISVSGPIVKDRTSFNIALRRSWFDLITTPLMAIANADTKADGERNTASYVFTDLNLQLNHRLGRLGTLSFTGYFGQDRLGGETDYWSTGTVKPENQYRDESDMGMRWGNLMAAAKWQLPVGDRWLHSLTLSYTRYNSTTTIEETSVQGEKGTESYDRSHIYREMFNGIHDVSLRSQWLWTATEHTRVRMGVDYVFHNFQPENSKERSTEKNLLHPHVNQSLRAHEAAAYVDGELHPRAWLKMMAGFRLSGYTVEGKSYVQAEPRLSANFLLSDAVSFKAGYAHMSQFVQQVSNAFISLPTDYWMPVTRTHAPQTSDQFSIGAYYTYHNRWNVSVEAWYKRMNHLLEYKEGFALLSQSVGWGDKLTPGRGTAKGIDLLIEKNFGRLAGYVGYGLLWTDRRFAEINRGRAFPSKYDNRHKLNIALSFRASKRLELNAAWTYMTGNLLTLSYEVYDQATGTNPDAPGGRYADPISYVDRKNNYRLPAFHRLDVGINFYRFHKRSKRTSIWNLSFYNAYSRHNPLLLIKRDSYDYVSQQDGTTERKTRVGFKSLSLFPIVPSLSYTLKF